jgi:hypothetical protein
MQKSSKSPSRRSSCGSCSEGSPRSSSTRMRFRRQHPRSFRSMAAGATHESSRPKHGTWRGKTAGWTRDHARPPWLRGGKRWDRRRSRGEPVHLAALREHRVAPSPRRTGNPPVGGSPPARSVAQPPSVLPPAALSSRPEPQETAHVVPHCSFRRPIGPRGAPGKTPPGDDSTPHYRFAGPARSPERGSTGRFRRPPREPAPFRDRWYRGWE